MKQQGYPDNAVVPVVIVEIVCALIYAIPQTAVLGAILLTGYLGGAVATHVRAGESTWYIAVIVGVVVWLGLLLRDARLRQTAAAASLGAVRMNEAEAARADC